MQIIRESIKPVVQNSKDVSINYDSLNEFAQSLERKMFAHWFDASPFDINKLSLKERIAYTFILDSISFSYWGDPKWKIDYNGKKYDGAKAMMACIGKAVDNGIPILDPKYLSKMNEKTLNEILEENVQIPLFEERRKILQEIGNNTMEYGGYENIIRLSRDASVLAATFVKIFPSFDDHSVYDGKKVLFYKRAQLLTADLAHILKGTDLEIEHYEQLTACADYKLPQIFRKRGMFKYSDGLEYKINNKIELNQICKEVIEIRANTIHAIDLIAEKIGAASNEVNDYVWLLSQKESFDDQPYIRVRTTAF